MAAAWEESRAAGNNFDAIRLFAAGLVIFSHSFEITTGTRDTEPLEVLSGQISLGELAVLIFFVVSGFLITKSWQAAPHLGVFLRKRALRILPAPFVCVGLLALVAGPILTNAPLGEYFSSPLLWAFLLNGVFIHSVGSLPGVFADAPFPATVNAPLWTLAFEAVCYGLVAVLGITRLLKPLGCAVVFLLLILIADGAWTFFGGSAGAFLFKLSLLGPSFFVGAMMALAADRIVLDARLAAAAAGVLVIATLMGGLVVAFALAGAYLTLYLAFASLGSVRHAGRFGDFSYGLYLWGWPVQQVVEQALPGSGWAVNFAIALPIALCLAVLSWRLVEKPALRLKVVKRQNNAAPSAAASVRS